MCDIIIAHLILFLEQHKMIIFHTDLDNTLIYSYKHDIGKDKQCVELYHGREISFVTRKTYEMLKVLKEKILIIPTTTRTIEQYERIHFGLGKFQYALVCNGGVLLENGKENWDWYWQSHEIVAECQAGMEQSRYLLQNDPDRNFDVRNIRDLFIFTKSRNPQKTVEMLKGSLNTEILDIFSNGTKVYVVPKRLNKGTAVQRFKEKLQAEKIVSAGDSEFDIPMLNYSDIGIAPKQLADRYQLNQNVIVMDNDGIFSEKLLEYIAKKI